MLAGHAITAVVGDGRGALIVGWDLTTRAGRAWTTTDGQAWIATELGDAVGGSVPSDIVVGAASLVALGPGTSTLVETADQLWRSDDGLAWEQTSALVASAEVAPGACPEPPATFDELIAMGSPKAASCFGSQALTITAFSSDCGGCGGVPAYRQEPAWINAWIAPWFISDTADLSGNGRNMSVWPAPTLGMSTLPPTGTPITVTGHFNDPVSTSCRTVPLWHGLTLPSAARTVAECRASFVITAIALG